MTLGDLLTSALKDAGGLAAERAQELAAAVITWGAENGHAGDTYYWPCRFRELSPSERDAAICREFNGRNLKEVCQRYGVSHMTVYRALHQR